MTGHSIHSLKFAILESLATTTQPQHKVNLIGRPLTGGLEYHLNRRFETEDRVQADRAFEELKAEGLIRPTYADLVDPENWVEITEA